MLIIVVVLLALLLVLGVVYVKYRVLSSTDNKNLESAIDAEVEKSMKTGFYPGIVVGVCKEARTYIKGYGVVNKEGAQKPDGTTVFQIGSISKVLTALLLQRLCDEGVVSMDATLGELLGGSTALSLSVRDVTLRQLATHTSGFPRIPKPVGEKIIRMAGTDGPMHNPYGYLDRQDVFNYLDGAEGKRKAGRFEYSNYGMGLLAHVLEVVTGEDYASMVREKVLLPLGMQHTAIKLSPEMELKLAQGYNPNGLPAPLWTFGALGGAGAYNSTANDLMTFVQASLAESGMASELLLKMSRRQNKGHTGIGWIRPSFIDRCFGGRRVVWHNGMVGGYASYIAIDRNARTGVVVLTNQASPTEMLGMMLMRQARTQSWSPSAFFTHNSG